MHTSSRPLLIVAISPIAGSLVILALAAVGRGVWITHLLAIAFGCSLVVIGSHLSHLGIQKITAFVIIILTLLGLATPLLGVTVASAVVVAQRCLGVFRLGVVVFLMAAITIWAFSLPDPLDPVPHVEGVFALALGYSLFAGVAIIASAVALVLGLWVQSFSGPFWLSAVASYYMVLFVCSATGITPAKLAPIN